MEPPAPRRRRRSLVVPALAGLALVGSLTITAVGLLSSQFTSRDGGPSAQPCNARPTARPSIDASFAAPPAGTGLRVREKGFTVIGPPGRTVSLGAIVENTSTLVAYRTRITFRVHDTAGRSALRRSPANCWTRKSR